MKISVDSPRIWTHKIENWRIIPFLPARVSTHGRVIVNRYKNARKYETIIAPTDDGKYIKYIFKHNRTNYAFTAKKLVADAFINPPAVGQVQLISDDYRDPSLFNIQRSWGKGVVPREIAYFIWKLVHKDKFNYSLYYGCNLEWIKSNFALTTEQLSSIIDSKLEDILEFSTAFDKFNSYSPYVEQYYWKSIEYFKRQGVPRPPILVYSGSPWGRIHSCLQQVETNIREKRMEWYNQVHTRFPNIWSGSIP